MHVDRSLLREAALFGIAAAGPARGVRQGDRRSAHKGGGLELCEHRAYEPGDDLRRVDWNAWARLGEVLTRLYHEDRNLRVRVILDASASMGFGRVRKIDRAGTLAAALALAALAGGDSVELACAGGTAPGLLRGHDPSALGPMLSFLERNEPAGVADGLPARLAAGARRDRVVLLSDLLVDDLLRERALRALRASSRAPVLVHVLSEEELDPDLGEATEARDAETGETLWLRSGPEACAAYERALHAWLDGLAARCAALGIAYVAAPTASDAAEVMRGPLLRRRVLRVDGAGGRP
jgi:uncharacterized protein (DUF58 family)